MSAERKWRQELRERIDELLHADDFGAAMAEIGKAPLRQAINALTIPLCANHSLAGRRAATAIGALVARLAERDLDAARTMVRRQMWNLNDESGCCAIGAPEAMAEILARMPALAREFAHILVSFINPEGPYLEHLPLQRGAVWGIGRLAVVSPELVQDAAPLLAPLLESEDAGVRGLAARALGMIGGAEGLRSLERLAEDGAEFEFYRDGGLIVLSVGKAARDAMKLINERCGLRSM